MNLLGKDIRYQLWEPLGDCHRVRMRQKLEDQLRYQLWDQLRWQLRFQLWPLLGAIKNQIQERLNEELVG